MGAVEGLCTVDTSSILPNRKPEPGLHGSTCAIYRGDTGKRGAWKRFPESGPHERRPPGVLAQVPARAKATTRAGDRCLRRAGGGRFHRDRGAVAPT
jgi:hypothetical protein